MLGTVWRMFALLLASLAVMLPWPLLGILVLQGQFDRSSEAFFFFGGITLFPLMILALFGNPSEEVLVVILMMVWLATAMLPNLFLYTRLVSWGRVVGLLGAQSLFAFLQAAMGAMLIIGKSV